MLQHGRAIRRFDDRKPEWCEQIDQDRPVVYTVIGDQDRLSRPRVAKNRAIGGGSGFKRSVHDWDDQVEPEGAAFSNLTLDLERAAHLLEQALADRQS